MNRRTRFLAGVLTLSALTFSFTETVFASMCTPMPEMAGMDDMDDMDDMDAIVEEVSEMTDARADVSSSGDPDCLLMSGHEERNDGQRRDSHCPLSPAVGAGCSAVASLPSTQIAAVPWTAGTAPGYASVDACPDLLLTHGLFRPPRA